MEGIRNEAIRVINAIQELIADENSHLEEDIRNDYQDMLADISRDFEESDQLHGDDLLQMEDLLDDVRRLVDRGNERWDELSIYSHSSKDSGYGESVFGISLEENVNNVANDINEPNVDENVSVDPFEGLPPSVSNSQHIAEWLGIGVVDFDTQSAGRSGSPKELPSTSNAVSERLSQGTGKSICRDFKDYTPSPRKRKLSSTDDDDDGDNDEEYVPTKRQRVAYVDKSFEAVRKSPSGCCLTRKRKRDEDIGDLRRSTSDPNVNKRSK